MTQNCGGDLKRSGQGIIEPLNLKQQLCNKLVQSGLLKDFDIINHSYTNGLCGKNPNSRQKLEDFIESTNGISPTLTTRPDTMGTMINYRIRKLTPKECWRLMGFTDADIEKAQSVGISNSQLYKQAGNSIVVPVLEEILRNLLCMREEKQCVY